MTSFKCHICGSHWTEGPTRDYAETACRKCLALELREEQERFEAIAGLMRFQPGLGWEMSCFIQHEGDEFEAHDLRRWLNEYINDQQSTGDEPTVNNESI